MESKLPLLLLGGAVMGIGAYYFLLKERPCEESILGGITSEYECYLKNILQFGCDWNGQYCVGQGSCEYTDESSCVNAGCNWCTDHCQSSTCGGGSVGCRYPNQEMCFSTPGGTPWAGNVRYKCLQNQSGDYVWQEQGTSPYCSNQNYRRLSCFQDLQNAYTTQFCETTFGNAADSCFAFNSRLGCSCGTEPLDDYTACCSSKVFQYADGQNPIVLGTGNLVRTPSLDWLGANAYVVDIDLIDMPFYANRIVFDIIFQANWCPTAPLPPCVYQMLIMTWTSANGPVTDIASWHLLGSYDFWEYLPTGDTHTGNNLAVEDAEMNCVEKFGFWITNNCYEITSVNCAWSVG